MAGAAHPYHNGGLRTALVEAGLRLARRDGAAGLGLREITRAVGVSPNAAYRHFPDRRALVLAVARETQDLFAQALLARIDASPSGGNPAEQSLRRLRAVGLGYIDFAISEPGWFEVAVHTHDEPIADGPPVTLDDRVAPPYQLLLDALDDLAGTGVLSAGRRVGAAWACWSAVHGFADLAVRGPLRRQQRPEVDRLAAEVVDTVINGLRD